MNKNLNLLLPLVVVLQLGFLVPASSQQAQPIGTANTIGTVSNSNSIGSTSSPSNATNSGSGSTKIILLPNGTRRSTSVSTLTVCDFTDFTGAFPDVVDVCRLK
jgi:hypothetical protein